MDLVFTPRDEQYFYNRSNSDAQIQLATMLEQSHTQPTKCLITSSGMAAIDAVMQNIFIECKWRDFNLVYGSELYGDTPRLFESYVSDYGVDQSRFHQIDVMNTEGIVELFQNELKSQVNILFLESCSNPSGYMFDFSIIDELKRQSNKLYVVVDNTWLTHWAFEMQLSERNFISVTSLTKYYSSGKCIGGAIFGKPKSKLFNRIQRWLRFHGQHVSPYHCQIMVDNFPNVLPRLQASSALTLQIAEFLQNHPMVVIVEYPLLANHPSYEMAQSLAFGPSVLIFLVPLPLDQAKEWLKQGTIIHKTSYGAHESKTDPWPVAIDDQHTWCRLSVGYEDTFENLSVNLDQMLMQLGQQTN